MKEILGHTSTYIETRRDQTINGKRKKKWLQKKRFGERNRQTRETQLYILMEIEIERKKCKKKKKMQ